MISFHCKTCNQKIKVADIHAGKKGKCPQCKNVVIIPRIDTGLVTGQISTHTDVQAQASAKNSTVSFKCSMCDANLLAPESSKGQSMKCPQCGYFSQVPVEKHQNIPAPALDNLQVKKTSDQNDEYSPFDRLVDTDPRGVLQDRMDKPVNERKLPWLIDIFLYPISTPGLVMMAIYLFTPIVFGLIMMVLVILLGPFSILLIPLGIAFGFFRITLIAYMYWYFCECVRDSAAGQIRAPEVFARGQGGGALEIFWQTLRVVACFLICFGPALSWSIHIIKGVYFTEGYQISAYDKLVLVALVGCGTFFFPMALLATVLFDSLRGMNPILIISSIFSTFFKYCGIILIFNVSIVAMVVIPVFLPWIIPWPWKHFSSGTSLYLMLVTAHLLGRFYYRNEEKLYWDV